jgi:[acyl-carrier-protein] S-malonyltransferase
VYPGNYNCPGQSAVAGKKERMEQLKRRLEKRNVRAVELAVGGPFHTPYMEAAASGLRKWMNSGKVMIHQPELILYSNRTAMPYESDKEKIVNTFTEQMMYPVKWEDTLLHMAEAGVDTFIECGPGKVLSGFVKRTIKGAKNYYVCDMESLKRTVKELGTVC